MQFPRLQNYHVSIATHGTIARTKSTSFNQTLLRTVSAHRTTAAPTRPANGKYKPVRVLF